MASFRVFVCLLGLVVLCDSACYFQKLVVKDLNNPPKECVDKDGKQHGFGSEWVRDCMACSCTSEGLSCCSMIPALSTVDIPDECEMVVNKETCTAKMLLKSDTTKECNLM
ncbi:beta-microseminoprotein [Clinocottus analis]|uniref:beta-microseminoprotein n=1 Tax=Clinocottus analis TaxID=304258 RepID=UPI0035BF0F65